MKAHQYIPAAAKKAAESHGASIQSRFIEISTPSGKERRLSAVVVSHQDHKLVYEHKADKGELFFISSTKGEDLPHWIRAHEGSTVNDQLTSVVSHFLTA